MEDRHNPVVAREGIPFLGVAVIALGLSLRYLEAGYSALAGLLAVLLYLVFRDPRRPVPASPLGVVSPVDGKVVQVDLMDSGVLQGEAHRIRIRINSLGTYTARAPVEGKIMDLRSAAGKAAVEFRTNALWIQTDEGNDVVLQFAGYRFGLAPRSFIRYGERVGQGQRSAYLRLTRFAEIHLPIASTVIVKPGQVVTAGADLIGKLAHSRV